MTPRISVVMPVRDGRPYLAEAIDSILRQTYDNFEFIVVDDGSEDGSQQVVELFVQNDSRLKLLRQSHGGVAAALRHAVESAQGELLARMDADDIAAPERFANQVELLDQHPEIVAVGSYIERIDVDGGSISIATCPLTHEDIDAGLLRGCGGLAHPTAMIRRQALDAVGGYRDGYPVSQDQDLWLRLAEHGHLANIPQPLLKCREHPQSVSMNRGQQQWESRCAAVREACQRRGISLPSDFNNVPSARQSPLEQRHDWVRSAARAGNLDTAWKHTRRLLRQRPFSPSTWKAFARVTMSVSIWR